ncbi:hypothetical protein AMTRI_Chr08g162730 [Amborella trichopoda]
MKPQKALNRPPTVLLLLFLALIPNWGMLSTILEACKDLMLFCCFLLFAKNWSNWPVQTVCEHVHLHATKGLGLTAHIIDHCKLVLKFPKDTNNTWYNVQFKNYEPLEYPFDVCETILLWEQYRNMTTILTREYLDARPNGWLEYAAQRISQLPPFYPRQFRTCAVVGNSGDLLKTEFGLEIDAHNAVIRENEAPVNEKYAKYVGLKRDFRLDLVWFCDLLDAHEITFWRSSPTLFLLCVGPTCPHRDHTPLFQQKLHATFLGRGWGGGCGGTLPLSHAPSLSPLSFKISYSPLYLHAQKRGEILEQVFAVF